MEKLTPQESIFNMKNCITLYNPHVDDFLAEPPHFKLLKRRALKKYGFFIQEQLNQYNEIRVMIDGSISAFIPQKYFVKLPALIRNLVASLEFGLWKRNNLFDNKVKRVTAPEVSNNEVLFAFSYKAAAGGFHLRKNLLSRYSCVVMHLSHYFVSTTEKSSNLQQLDNIWLGGDSDIRDNLYFKHFFPWYKRDFLVLSFAVALRFKNLQPFENRKNCCIATGSFHDLHQETPAEKYFDYMSFTGISTYHPIRKQIYEQAEMLKAKIKSEIHPYRKLDNTSKFKKIFRHFQVAQKKYFAIDIVQLYNDYQYALVGEEFSGFPALGTFEAMACGCVTIGNPKAYIGLGLIEWVHYIPYDGTLENLLYMLKQDYPPDELINISKNSSKFIEDNFRVDQIYTYWDNNLTNSLNLMKTYN